jgi:O-antigen/teichoic acid export membrane protein
VVSDGVANIIRVAVSALSVVAVTPVISRTLSPAEFSLWMLAVSISAYVMLAEAGVTLAVTRFVAVDLATGGRETPTIMATAIWTVMVLSGVGVVIVVFLVSRTTWLLREVPAELLHQARWIVIVLALSVGVGVVGRAAQGYFFAIHRAIVPATTTVVVSAATTLGLIMAGIQTRSTLWLASITLVGAVVLSGTIVILAQRATGAPIASLRLVRRSRARELARHSSTLVWWSIMMLAITGVDVLVVGAFDFEKVGAYGVAVQGVTFVLGLFSAMMAPVTAVSARLHAEKRPDEVERFVVDSSRVGVTALVVFSGALFVVAPWIVELYAGSRYVDTTVVILRILILGNVIRNVCFPLGLALVATGEHRRVIAPPFVEAAVNLVLSLWWVQVIGANGVAWATCVAATLAVGLHLALTLRRTTTFSVSARTFSTHTIARPAIAAIPAVMAFVFEASVGKSVFVVIPALFGSVALAWCVSLTVADRRRLRALARLRPNGRSR